MLRELNLGEFSSRMEELFPEFSVDFGAFFSRILQGQAGEAFRTLTGELTRGIEAEAGALRSLFLTLLLIGILSAVFSVVMQTFQNHQIADIAHFAAYLLMLYVVLRTFSQAAETAESLLERMLLFVRLFVPTFMLALGLSAGALTAAGYYQLILLLIYGVEQLLMSLGLPLVNLYMMLVVMNGIWEEERLGALVELVQKGIISALKFLLTCVTGIGLLQSMVTPVLERLQIGTVSKALSAIPGLGGLAEGTAQLLLGSAVLIKNAFGVAGVLFLMALCLTPLLKLLAWGAILKLCAGLMGLTADKRLTGCVSRSGDALLLLLRLVYTAGACFLILFAVVVCLAGTVG